MTIPLNPRGVQVPNPALRWSMSLQSYSEDKEDHCKTILLQSDYERLSP